MLSHNPTCRFGSALLGVMTGTACGADLPISFYLSPLEHGPLAHSEQGYVQDVALFGEMRFTVSLLIDGWGSSEAVVGPHTDGFDAELYVVMTDSDLVAAIDESGELDSVGELTLPPFAGPFRSPAFDALGWYGGSLFLIGCDNRIWEVGPAGDISAFSPTGDFVTQNLAQPDIITLACDPHGAFGGTLLLTDSAGRLHMVDEDGSTSLLATGLGETDHTMLFSPGGGFGDDLYVADAGAGLLLRISPDHMPGADAPIWVDLADTGLDIEPASVAISIAGPFGADVMYVSDAVSGGIFTFAPDGTFLGQFMAGLGGPATIELPRTGIYKGKMIAEINGTVWILEPNVIAQPDNEGTTPAGGLDGNR